MIKFYLYAQLLIYLSEEVAVECVHGAIYYVCHCPHMAWRRQRILEKPTIACIEIPLMLDAMIIQDY